MNVKIHVSNKCIYLYLHVLFCKELFKTPWYCIFYCLYRSKSCVKMLNLVISL